MDKVINFLFLFIKRHHCLFRQDISGFRGKIDELNQFNEAGRAKLALLRKSIERLDDYVADLNNPTLSAEIDSHRQQFSRYNFFFFE